MGIEHGGETVQMLVGEVHLLDQGPVAGAIGRASVPLVETAGCGQDLAGLPGQTEQGLGLALTRLGNERRVVDVVLAAPHEGLEAAAKIGVVALGQVGEPIAIGRRLVPVEGLVLVVAAGKRLRICPIQVVPDRPRPSRKA